MFVVALGVYLVTLAPTVGLIDSGELTTAARTLGNPHAPGFPFYLLVTHVVMWIPIGSVAVRANFASALFAALAAALVGLVASEVVAALPSRKKRRAGSPTRPHQTATGGLESPPYVLLAGLLFAFSRTLWAYATIAEVYALNAFLLAGVLLCVLTWRRTRDDRLLYLAALLFGLGLAVHHVTIGLTLPAIALVVIRTQFRWRTLAICFALACVGLLVYAYEPWAAHRHPPINWGNPGADAEHFIAHVTGKQYQGYIDPSRREEQFRSAMSYLGKDLGILGLLLAIGGALIVFRRDRLLFGFLALIWAADIIWITVYWIINDQDAYLLPAIMAMVIAATVTGSRLVSPRWSPALLVVPLVAAVMAWPARNRSHYSVAADYATDALAAMRPNALLLTNDYQLYSPLTYFIEVEKRRPDVEYISTGSLIRSWYLDFIEYHYPDLAAAVRPQLDAFRPLVNKWEHTPGAAWDADVDTRVQFFGKLDDLIAAMVSQRLAAGRPVYAGLDFFRAKDAGTARATQRLNQMYGVAPRGVVVEYVSGANPQPIASTPLHTDALRRRYEPNDIVVTDVIPTYADAYLLRARVLAYEQRLAEATAEYRRALALQPDNEAAARELERVSSPPTSSAAATPPSASPSPQSARP